MAYITESNLRRIIARCDLTEIEFDCPIYENMEIFILNKYEKKTLQAIQKLLKKPEDYIKYYYRPIDKKRDSLKYIYEGGTPSYHENIACEGLNSDYKNYEIPKEIKEKGEEYIKKFREWFKQNKELFESKSDIFVFRLFTDWNIKTSLKAIDRQNTGIVELEDYNIDSLDAEIRKLLRESGRIYKASTKNTKILKRYSRKTFLAYKEDFEVDEDIPYTKEEVIELLIEYDTLIKRPLINRLIEYYRIKLNPNLEMKGKLLEVLGFKPCFRCCTNS